MTYVMDRDRALTILKNTAPTYAVAAVYYQTAREMGGWDVSPDELKRETGRILYPLAEADLFADNMVFPTKEDLGVHFRDAITKLTGGEFPLMFRLQGRHTGGMVVDSRIKPDRLFHRSAVFGCNGTEIFLDAVKAARKSLGKPEPELSLITEEPVITPTVQALPKPKPLPLPPTQPKKAGVEVEKVKAPTISLKSLSNETLEKINSELANRRERLRQIRKA